MKETATLILDPVVRLSKDLKQAAMTMDPDEVRYLVDMYYILQDGRIRADGQVRSMGRDDKEPHETIVWLSKNFGLLEGNVKRALGAFADAHEAGQWAQSIIGIGPVIASGLLAHIDIHKTPTVSALWSFAGQNPNAVWAKGQKRPWNARLKVICWHAGESFKRLSGNPDCLYGKLYRQRKELEVSRSESGMFAEIAAQTIKDKKYRKDTETFKAYEAGKLPAGRLDLRATRYATKIFLSHFWAVLYESTNGKKPEDPWIIAHGGHEHRVPVPNWPMKT